MAKMEWMTQVSGENVHLKLATRDHEVNLLIDAPTALDLSRALRSSATDLNILLREKKFERLQDRGRPSRRVRWFLMDWFGWKYKRRLLDKPDPDWDPIESD